MSETDSDQTTDEGEGSAPEEPEFAPTPFDHPFFLPVLLLAMAVWFGYDGWFNEQMEWKKFNQYGFFPLAAGGIYFTVKAFRERKKS